MEPTDELQLQQLLQTQFWQKHCSATNDAEEQISTIDAQSVPQTWELTRGIILHSWQDRCVDAWFTSGKRGIIKVVTGAGKTMLALAIAERLQQTEVQKLRIAIVVPTIVLLDQWKEELLAHSNLPASAIGFLGGGLDCTYDDQIRILICVLNSASKKLPNLVRDSGVGSSLLLIVDECHRAGATEMQKIFCTERSYNLGLSATPERDNDIKEDDEAENDTREEANLPVEFENTVLGQEIGPVIFELNYAEAIDIGVLPPFGIVHYGLSLRPHESAQYERISREIKDLRKELERPGRQGLGLIRWCRSRAAKANPAAARLVGLTSERKRLLFHIEERAKAVLHILRDAFSKNPNTKAILFHESINEVMRLFFLLRAEGFPIVAEHSEFPDHMRATSLKLFRQDAAKVIISARSLIEGFNIPSADVGIIVAASSSVRQRVQTLGRLLRKTQTEQGFEKHAVLHVLYASKTVDEMIYEKADWEHFVGAERNQYYLWPDVDSLDPEPVAKAPRTPAPDELMIEETILVSGETYPGNLDQGVAFTRDTQGTIRTEDGRFIDPHHELFNVLKKSRKTAGRFRVTPSRQFVIELDKTIDGWRGVYLGRLSSLIKIVEEAVHTDLQHQWKPGDIYPLSQVSGKTFSVLQRDPRLIALKESGRIRFVIPSNQVSDPDKRQLLSNIQLFLQTTYNTGHRVNKITVTTQGHVVYVFNNQAFFVGQAPDGKEGFHFES